MLCVYCVGLEPTASMFCARWRVCGLEIKVYFLTGVADLVWIGSCVNGEGPGWSVGAEGQGLDSPRDGGQS